MSQPTRTIQTKHDITMTAGLLHMYRVPFYYLILNS